MLDSDVQNKSIA